MTTSHHSHPTEIGPVLAGRHVHDEAGGDIGSVTDVLFDRRGRAEYLVVDPGLFRRTRYVPAEGAYLTDDAVVVPWNKARVTRAMKASGTHVLSHRERQTLERYYGLEPEQY